MDDEVPLVRFYDDVPCGIARWLERSRCGVELVDEPPDLVQRSAAVVRREEGVRGFAVDPLDNVTTLVVEPQRPGSPVETHIGEVREERVNSRRPRPARTPHRLADTHEALRHVAAVEGFLALLHPHSVPGRWRRRTAAFVTEKWLVRVGPFESDGGRPVEVRTPGPGSAKTDPG